MAVGAWGSDHRRATTTQASQELVLLLLWVLLLLHLLHCIRQLAILCQRVVDVCADAHIQAALNGLDWHFNAVHAVQQILPRQTQAAAAAAALLAAAVLLLAAVSRSSGTGMSSKHQQHALVSPLWLHP
jgi:hypothetical protein